MSPTSGVSVIYGISCKTYTNLNALINSQIIHSIVMPDRLEKTTVSVEVPSTKWTCLMSDITTLSNAESEEYQSGLSSVIRVYTSPILGTYSIDLSFQPERHHPHTQTKHHKPIARRNASR